MTRPNFPGLEVVIARCRVFLSLMAIVAVYVDPTGPTLMPWLPLTSGPFTIDRYALAVLLGYLLYSVVVYVMVSREPGLAVRVSAVTPWTDVAFGAAIAAFTEGVSSPFYAFFMFAVVAVGFGSDFRRTMVVTTTSVLLYLSLILVSKRDDWNFYLMRPVYLAIVGYLVGFLGQQRQNLEEHVRDLQTAMQRQRIARSLHDGYAQALAGINLRLESCRELLRRGEREQVVVDLTQLQAGVNREHDALRAYIYALTDRPPPPAVSDQVAETDCTVRATFTSPLPLVEEVLQIVREGVVNIQRHARARHATVAIENDGRGIAITIDDDGVGFPEGTSPPWAIVTRVDEIGGSIEALRDRGAGAHLVVHLPLAAGGERR